MHNFQPYPMNMLEWNPSDKIAKEWFALVTEADGHVNAMTCSWGGVGVIWNKNSATVYVRESRYSHELLEKSEFFSICFLDPNEKGVRNTLKYLGSASGKEEDKIKNAGLHINHDMKCPYLDESSMVIVCKKMAAVPMPKEAMKPEIADQFYADGDLHTMYIGEIVDILAR